MDAWDPWLVWDRVHGKAKQRSMGKHGTAWHGIAWESCMGMGLRALAAQEPSRAGRPSLAVSKHGRRAEGERARERERVCVYVCVCARKSSDPQLTWERLGK